MNYHWLYKNPDREEAAVEQLVKEMHLCRPVCALLVGRGIDTPAKARAFLTPPIDGFGDPFLFPDMEKAAARIFAALDECEKITIYGDYDVDGMTSTAALLLALNELGADVDYYIPDRIEEGYGLNLSAMDALKERGTRLIITVDSGITGLNEAKRAKELGMDMIITDHHTPGEELPEALAVINPKLPDCPYPDTELAGVGVAFKLIQALIGEEESIAYLDLIALGTIADMVPLMGENRVIAKHGLRLMEERRRPGIAALLDQSGLNKRKLTADHVGYMIAPRINAGGRVGDPREAVELLITDSPSEAFLKVAHLDSENERRRAIEASIVDEAMEMILNDPGFEREPVLVLEGTDWHSGVVGIVASRLLEHFHKPTVVLTGHEDCLKGSARSVPGISMYELLSSVSEHLIKFGGHTMAAGLTIRPEKVQDFRRAINENARVMFSDPELYIPKKEMELILSAEDLTEELFYDLEKLEPYGPGNPKPLTVVQGLRLRSFGQIGAQNNHLKMVYDVPGMRLEGIFFHQNGGNWGMFPKARLDACAYLEVNEFNDMRRMQLMVKDMQLCYDGNPVYEKLMRNYSHCTAEMGEKAFIDSIGGRESGRNLGHIRYHVTDSLKMKYDFLEKLLGDGSFAVVCSTVQEAYRAQQNIRGSEVRLRREPSLHFIISRGSEPFDTTVMLDFPFAFANYDSLLDAYPARETHLCVSWSDYNDNLEMLSSILPGEMRLKQVYRLLLKVFQDPGIRLREVDVMKKYYLAFRDHLSLMQLRFSLQIFKELNLLDFELTKDILSVRLTKNPPKVRLNDAETFRMTEGVYTRMEEAYKGLLRLYM